MKKSIIFSLLTLGCTSVFSQIFTRESVDKSITITPRGIEGNYGNTMAITNTTLGAGALNSIYLGDKNVAIGNNALYTNTVGNDNVAVGYKSLFANIAGSFNVGLGTNVLSNNAGGYRNVAIGPYVMFENTLGHNNTALGDQALRYNVANSRSTAVGAYSILFADDRTEGRNTYNTAVGHYALYGSSNPSSNTGRYNTAIGDSTMSSNTSGQENTAVGQNALSRNTTGNNATAVGKDALQATTTGTSNTAVGYQAGFSNTTGSRNVFIGFKAGYNSAVTNDNLVIENSDSTNALIRGDFEKNKVGINRLAAGLNSRSETFQVDGEAFKTAGTGNWIIPSDRRLKENIVYLNSQETLSQVLRMKGVKYNWIDKSKGSESVYGFIAQDLQQVYPENVRTDKEGYLSASYGAYDPMLVESIKALKVLIDEQRVEIELLKTKIKIQEEMISSKAGK